MGILVVLVIVYQVLSTDVADHLREYATFKAMAYSQPFFLGIIIEEAIILAVFGFFPGFLSRSGFMQGWFLSRGFLSKWMPAAQSLFFWAP